MLDYLSSTRIAVNPGRQANREGRHEILPHIDVPVAQTCAVKALLEEAGVSFAVREKDTFFLDEEWQDHIGMDRLIFSHDDSRRVQELLDGIEGVGVDPHSLPPPPGGSCESAD